MKPDTHGTSHSARRRVPIGLIVALVLVIVTFAGWEVVFRGSR